MAEYIEREAAIDAIMKVYVRTAGYKARERVFEAEEAVHRLPVADVTPVRHAKWVDNHCTACGMAPMGDEMWKNYDCEPPLFDRFMDYCPTCGAKMDGDSDAKEN